MDEIRTLDKLIKKVGTATTNNFLMEYILLLRGKADVLDKIEKALNNNATIEDVKIIIEEASNNIDFME